MHHQGMIFKYGRLGKQLQAALIYIKKAFK